MILILMYCQAL